MIRLDQRNVDIQGTERVFKKVVHSGQNAIRFVDKDGVPLRMPNTTALTRLHSTYTLSPRGVPTRKSNHSYSGQLAQAKMQNMVNSLETSSQEMASYTSMHSYGNGLSSAGSSRHYLSTAHSQKRRSFGPPRSMKSMVKSASSQQSARMLVSAPGPDLSVEPALENTNDSPQGKRLEKEWSALSQCRALKRSSEIVSHRVDRMYFMTGNKLKLQSKYHVEDDELRHLRELHAARASARITRGDKLETDQAGSDRLEQIEKKLSNIEHRLTCIEEQSEDRKHVGKRTPRKVHIRPMEVISRSSSESGIHEEDEDEADRDFIDREMRKRQTEEEDWEDRRNVQSVKRVEIRPVEKEENEPVGVQLWDIMSHHKSTVGAVTMLKLFEDYPNTQPKVKHSYNRKVFRKMNEMTLGVPRKIRQAKMKVHKKGLTQPAPEDREGVVSPQCRYCICDLELTNQKEPKTFILLDNEQELLKQSFPTRKPSVKISHHQKVECDCRLDAYPKKGPLLSITGHQVPLCDRDILYT